MRTLKIMLTMAMAVLFCGVSAAESEQEKDTTKTDASSTTNFQDMMEEAEKVEKSPDASEKAEKQGEEMPDIQKQEKLSKEERQKVQENLEKTSSIYGKVLQGKPERRRAAIKDNLNYVSRRLKKAKAEKKDVVKKYNELRTLVASELKDIKNRDLPKDVKDKKARELYSRYEGRITLLETQKKSLKNEIKRLQERVTELQRKKDTFAKIQGKSKEEKKDIWNEVDGFLKEEQQRRAEEGNVQ